jgi:uncharacterized protein
MRAKRSAKDIKPLISEIKKVISELYGESLVKIILYGSFARDEATSESDIDIAVVLKDDVNKFQELDRLHDAVYPIALKYGELVSFYPISENEFSDTEWPLHYHIHKEGMKV